jgi:hypothetical protein
MLDPQALAAGKVGSFFSRAGRMIRAASAYSREIFFSNARNVRDALFLPGSTDRISGAGIESKSQEPHEKGQGSIE